MQNKAQQSIQKDSIIQLQQKIIHYRSEISRYKQQLESYERKLKVKESMERNINVTQAKDEKSTVRCQAYFSYSTILPNSNDENVIIIGNFILKNTGNQPLTIPIICIRITPVETVNLSGKIKSYSNNKQDDDRIFEESAVEEWIYVHDNWREKIKSSGEHWLRPTHQTTIQPGEQMSFSNFNLTLSPPKEGNTIIVSGFVYSQELKQGGTALNQIIINY